ncbi:MAG: MvaI/BcnI restriction endonuclease family protein [Mesorhizobium sp.]|nr:MvaI/BcnI restriction endonuclease family protein [Mesorhizobium sp.]
MPKKKDPLPDLSLEQLRTMMKARGVKQLLLKVLAPNDNSKNQPYLSSSMNVVNILPADEIVVTETKEGNRIMKAALPLEWLQPDGSSIPAPHAKLILYPQYPEVRFSGFLKGAVNAPNELLTTRMPRRMLLLGITDDRRIIGWCVGPGSNISNATEPDKLEPLGVFRIIPLDESGKSGRILLLEQLRRIHLLDWMDAKKLTGAGPLPFGGTNAIGYTLEAELGILPNGTNGPDFEGWEIKAIQARNYARIPPGKVTTLITPQPDAGHYTAGLVDFVKKYGYPDRRGRPDRLNVGGVHRVGLRHPLTGFTPTLVGFDVATGKVTDPAGKLVLLTDAGEEAASWSFAKLLQRWNTKHALAAYVPAETRTGALKQYRFGNMVMLAEGTDFNRFLSVMAARHAVYDPGIKVEQVSTDRPKSKHRNQFRTSNRYLPDLYEKVTTVDVLVPAA